MIDGLLSVNARRVPKRASVGVERVQDSPGSSAWQIRHALEAQVIDSEEVGLVSRFLGGSDNLLDLLLGENVRQCPGRRRFDDVDPRPLFIQDMFVKELESIAVNLDGAPGVGLDHFIEVSLEFPQGDIIGTTIEVIRNTSYSLRITIDR